MKSNICRLQTYTNISKLTVESIKIFISFGFVYTHEEHGSIILWLTNSISRSSNGNLNWNIVSITFIECVSFWLKLIEYDWCNWMLQIKLIKFDNLLFSNDFFSDVNQTFFAVSLSLSALCAYNYTQFSSLVKLTCTNARSFSHCDYKFNFIYHTINKTNDRRTSSTRNEWERKKKRERERKAIRVTRLKQTKKWL